MDAVIKVGGSLSENQNVLCALGMMLSTVAQKKSIAVMPGGGKFADTVREIDLRYALQPELSHKMAILAMDQYGLFLSQFIQQSRIVTSLSGTRNAIKSNYVPIILPSRIIFRETPFEPSWDVTSDSISAYIATRLKSFKLVLITDVDGIFSQDPKSEPKANLIEQITAAELRAKGERTSVDKHLPSFLLKSPIDTYVINGEHPERVESILSSQPTKGTRIF